MKKINPSLEEVHKLHQAGQLEEAKQGYLELLKQRPEDATVIHWLGILLAEMGDLHEAENYLRKAILLCHDDPTFYLHLANILKAKGSFEQAEQVLLDMIQSYPRFAAAWNNLGTVYFAQEKWPEAITQFYAAINLQSNYVDAYFNLGLALNKLNRNQEAILIYQSLLELAPQHVGGQFQLGCLLMRQGKNEDAINHFLSLEQKYPLHFETQSNLASCFLRTGRLLEARAHYLQALTIEPGDTQILFNLGVIGMQQGQVQEAIEYYLLAIKNVPDFFDAHNNLGVAFLALNNKEKALWHFREALRISPRHEFVRHAIQVLMQDKNLSSSPPAYIRALFDSYADHYDTHVCMSLNYQVPMLFYAAVKKALPIFPEGGLDILDLGCGTGLCGDLFKPLSRSLTGIDLSEKMLNLAKQKQIYDELHHEEIMIFLSAEKQKQRAFDLVMAGDVLVYMGDLCAVFSAIVTVLRQNGLFIFNTEMTDHIDYQLTESGRFAHHIEYVQRLARQHQLKVLESRIVTLRSQHQQEVQGYLFVLQK